MDSRIIDMTGQRIGHLLITGYAYSKKGGSGTYAYWNCLCDCGEITVMRGSHLRSKRIKSCGCVKAELAANYGNTKITHGCTRNGKSTPEYESWSQMKKRCYNKKHEAYNRYGGRGITVCDRWKNSFENFFADMGVRPDGMSLDRINNNKGYYPENCKWATMLEQSRNKCNNHLVTLEDREFTISELAEKNGLSYGKLHKRIVAGWSVEDAIKDGQGRLNDDKTH